jgi:hypothetical protein
MGSVSGPSMSPSRELLHRAEQTVLLDQCLAGTVATKSGTSSSTPRQLSHRSDQNSVEALFPTIIVTDALKKDLIMASSQTGIDARGLLGSIR